MPGLVERLRELLAGVEKLRESGVRGPYTAVTVDGEMESLLREAADRIEKDGAVLEDVWDRISFGHFSESAIKMCPLCNATDAHLSDCALAEATEVER